MTDVNSGPFQSKFILLGLKVLFLSCMTVGIMMASKEIHWNFVWSLKYGNWEPEPNISIIGQKYNHGVLEN